MVVTATYSNGSSAVVTDYTYVPTTALTTEDETVTVSFGGKSTSVSISVAEKELVGIAITTPPTKTTYEYGETFDPTGMVVTASYNNNTSEVVTGYTWSPDGQLTTSGTVAITISYEGETATQNVTVQEQPVTLTSIEITTQPTKTIYGMGSNFNPAGMVVQANYSNNTSAVLSSEDYTITGGTNLVDPAQVTISYTEGAVTVGQTPEIILIAEIHVTANGTGYVVGDAWYSSNSEDPGYDVVVSGDVMEGSATESESIEVQGLPGFSWTPETFSTSGTAIEVQVSFDQLTTTTYAEVDPA